MISIIGKSFTSTIYDIFIIVLIVFFIVSVFMWIALPIILFSIRNELKKLNKIIQDYVPKNKM